MEVIEVPREREEGGRDGEGDQLKALLLMTTYSTASTVSCSSHENHVILTPHDYHDFCATEFMKR